MGNSNSFFFPVTRLFLEEDVFDFKVPGERDSRGWADKAKSAESHEAGTFSGRLIFARAGAGAGPGPGPGRGMLCVMIIAARGMKGGLTILWYFLLFEKRGDCSAPENHDIFFYSAKRSVVNPRFESEVDRPAIPFFVFWGDGCWMSHMWVSDACAVHALLVHTVPLSRYHKVRCNVGTCGSKVKSQNLTCVT